MSHLLAISVGPVQEFIAAARRTRDLWFGSYLLSEISKAVAKSIRDHDGKLIFPHPDTDLDSGDDKINVANIVLAELPTGEPQKVAATAKQAAQARWRAFADEARQAAAGAIRDEVWDDQVDDVIEFYAAWVPHTEPQRYKEDRACVMRLLAGRKNCRDFLPAKGRPGIPKSSLDGQRETVLRDGDRTTWPQKLRLSPGEQLDVVGITKRLGKRQGESDPRYPSVARVGAETWLRGVHRRDQDKFQRLKDACEDLVSKGLNTVREENYQYFPYEGTVIYQDRHADLKNELGLGDNDLDEVAAALKDIGGEPNPYLAVLVADGDRMGAAISSLTSAGDHRGFSQALAGFATEARKIVNDHNGVLVYAGGDDVLAFLPVNKCLKCGRKLHDDFGSRLAMYGNPNPTLSVGIAIGHFMENLEDLLEFGRSAEKAAKQVEGKDALAVHLHKRGGAPVQVQARWGENPDERFERLAELMNEGTLPTKLPYDLRMMARLYESWNGNADGAIQRDLVRLVARKQSRGLETVRAALSTFLDDMSAGKLLVFAEELVVARQIATSLQQAGERPVRVEEAAS